jgi:hypothetical protein
LEQLKQELEEKRQAFEQERLDWERMNNVTMGNQSFPATESIAKLG